MAIYDINSASSRTTDPRLLKGFQGSGFAFVLVLWFGGGGEWGRHSWKPKYTPLHVPRVHDLPSWSVISEKQLSISVNSIGPF